MQQLAASERPANAVGLLKEEMRRLGSLVIAAADQTAVPAGKALAVDRVAFARRITEAIESHPRIRVVRGVVERIPDGERVILATGPLTEPGLARDLRELLGDEYLYFYDAISPIVYADSIDHEIAFRASRYEEGEGDYLNLPLSEARVFRLRRGAARAPRRCRCTVSRRRSSSRAVSRSRRWRAAARGRWPSGR